MTQAKKITAWGETKTFREWYADPRCKVGSLHTLRSRIIQGGWDPEKALSVSHVDRSTDLVCWGESKGNTEWTRDPRCVVSSADTIRHRRRMGWPAEKVLTHPVGKTKPGPAPAPAPCSIHSGLTEREEEELDAVDLHPVQARLEVSRLRKEVKRWRDGYDKRGHEIARLKLEVERLRAQQKGE